MKTRKNRKRKGVCLADEQQTQHSDLLPGYLFESLIEAVPELSNNHSLILTNDDDPLKDLGAQTTHTHTHTHTHSDMRTPVSARLFRYNS